VNTVLEEIYSTGKVYRADGTALEAFPAVVPYDDGLVLRELTWKFANATTLETGMALGASSLFMCQAHEENGGGRHIAIDPYQSSYWESIGRLNVERAGYGPMLELIEERSITALPRLAAGGTELNVAFIDGNHRFEHVFIDFFYIDRMLQQGGYIVFHDAGMLATRKIIALIQRMHGAYYELAREYLPKLSPLRRVWDFVHFLAVNPMEPVVARMMLHDTIAGAVVFRKKAHQTEQDYDEQWEYYRAF